MDKKFEEYRRKLFHLNHDMLGLGAPIEKDDVGYNRPDFCKMENLGYYPEVMLTEQHCFMILNVLMNYKNTQLGTESEFFDEVLKYFEENHPEIKKINMRASVPVYLDGEIRKTGVLLNHFTPSDELKEFVMDTEVGRWVKDSRNRKRLEVKWNHMDEALSYFEDAGFITDRFKEMITQKPEDASDEDEVERPKAVVLEVKDGYMYIQSPYNRETVEYVRMSNTAKTTKFNGQWATKTPVHQSQELIAVYEKNGIDMSDVKKAVAETPYTEPKKPAVTVVKITEGLLYLQYGYHARMHQFVKDNSSRFKLVKEQAGYLLRVNPYDCDDLLQMFEESQFDIVKLKETINSILNDTSMPEFDIISVAGNLMFTQNKISPLTKELGKHGVSYRQSMTVSDILNDEELYTYLTSIAGKYKAKKGLENWMEKMEGKNIQYPMIYPAARPFEPYKFQLEDISEMLSKKRCLLANDMGCGKTMESVWVGLSLPFSKLVICPPSLRLNWVKEIRNFKPDADVHVIYSNEQDVEEHDWMIVGYPSLVKHLDKLLSMDIRCVMADEAHFIKAVNNWGEPTSKRAAAALSLAAKADYCYAITGTPKTSRNKDIFNLLKFIKHPLAKEKFITFADRYCDGHHETFGYRCEGNSNDKELNSLIKPYMIRHLKSEVLPDLKKIRQAIPVTANIREYNRYLKEAIAEMRKKNNQKDPIVLSLLTKARQSLALSKASETYDMANTIMEGGESVVIATCFTGVIEELEKKFKDNCCKVVGGMTDKAKQAAIDAFQKGDKQVILLNIQAGGVGITLTKSHIMIFNDFPWTTGELTQMEDRICRTGQDETCIIYYMVSEDVEMEQKLAETLTSKSRTINAAIDDNLGEDISIIDIIQKAC